MERRRLMIAKLTGLPALIIVLAVNVPDSKAVFVTIAILEWWLER